MCTSQPLHMIGAHHGEKPSPPFSLTEDAPPARVDAKPACGDCRRRTKNGATLGEWGQFTQALLHSTHVRVLQRHASGPGPPGHGPATRREPGNPQINSSSPTRPGITASPTLLLPPSGAAWQPPGYFGTRACGRQEAASLVLPAGRGKRTGYERKKAHTTLYKRLTLLTC